MTMLYLLLYIEDGEIKIFRIAADRESALAWKRAQPVLRFVFELAGRELS